MKQQEENKASLKKEILITALITILLSTIIAVVIFFIGSFHRPSDKFELTYSKDKTISFEKPFFFASLGFGGLLCLADSLAFYFIHPSRAKSIAKRKNVISYVILSLFGYLAFLVLSILLSGFAIPPLVTSLISAILVTIYQYLIYKLYFEEKTYSNSLFWELFRFAIVGLVAAVFDFLTCFLVQFIFFKGNEAGYVTAIATGCGFFIGVIINYLMSTYMVYKASKSNLSKSWKGILLFFILSAIGLGIGIGIQYFLYDFLFLQKSVQFFSYPIDFVIRTLIVMVYNYISRKVLIYR